MPTIIDRSGFRFQLDFGTKAFPRGSWKDSEWDAQRPRWKQVHGVDSLLVSAPAQECGEVDGLWTPRSGIPIGVVTADCVPVLLFHARKGAIAALHAGWRGTYHRIIPRFFERLREDFADPGEWSAVIGPSIRPCCYQVSPEMIENFKNAFPSVSADQLEPAPRMLDLIAVLRRQLSDSGARLESVHPDCTFCASEGNEPRYFSYRRGDRESRQFSVITFISKT